MKGNIDFKIGSLSILTGISVGVVVSIFRLTIPILMEFIESLSLFGKRAGFMLYYFFLYFLCIVPHFMANTGWDYSAEKNPQEWIELLPSAQSWYKSYTILEFLS